MLGIGNWIASSTYAAYTLYKTLWPNGILGTMKANLRSKGKNKGHIAFLPTSPSP